MPPAGLTRKIVVCIDDNHEGLAVRKVFLETMGYDVLLAHSAMEGLELLHRHPVAAVILDFHMPDMAGDELAAKIRSSFPSLPIIMLSGRIGEIPPHCSGIVDGFVRKGEPASRLLTTLKDLTH